MAEWWTLDYASCRWQGTCHDDMQQDRARCCQWAAVHLHTQRWSSAPHTTVQYELGACDSTTQWRQRPVQRYLPSDTMRTSHQSYNIQSCLSLNHIQTCAKVHTKLLCTVVLNATHTQRIFPLVFAYMADLWYSLLPSVSAGTGKLFLAEADNTRQSWFKLTTYS